MLPCPAPDTCWVYLIRHGATEHNLAQPPRLQGRRLNAPLSDPGRWQAERTAALLASALLQSVYTSPLLRARQTAEMIALPRALPVIVHEGLIEVDVGRWEGLSWDAIHQIDPQRSALFETDPGRYGYPEGENFLQVQQRTIATFSQIVQEHLGHTIAVVAHNVVNRCYLTHVLGIPVSQYRLITQDNCGVSLLRFKEAKPKLITMNAVFHLADGQELG